MYVCILIASLTWGELVLFYSCFSPQQLLDLHRKWKFTMTLPSPHLQPGLKPKRTVTKSMIPTLMEIKRKTSLMQRSHAQMPMCVLSCFSPVWFLVDCSLPGSSVHGILQAKILEWVTMPSSRGSSQHWDLPDTCISCVFWITGRFFITEPLEKSPRCYRDHVVASKSTALSTGPSSYSTLMNY